MQPLSYRFTKIETLSPRNHIHYFRIHSPEDMDAEMLARLREAYRQEQPPSLASLASSFTVSS